MKQLTITRVDASYFLRRSLFFRHYDVAFQLVTLESWQRWSFYVLTALYYISRREAKMLMRSFYVIFFLSSKCETNADDFYERKGAIR